MVVQVLAGAGIAAGVLATATRRGGPTGELLTATLGLAAAWMMLLGPATESSSFVLLAPSLAWSVVEDLQVTDWRHRRGLLWGSCALFTAAVLLGGFSNAVKIHSLGVHSWASLFYFIYLLMDVRPLASVRNQAAPPAAAQRYAA